MLVMSRYVHARGRHVVRTWYARGVVDDQVRNHRGTASLERGPHCRASVPDPEPRKIALNLNFENLLQLSAGEHLNRFLLQRIPHSISQVR